ncbi:MAG: DUF4465 domain-containing protein [Paludibacter sp.]
MKKTNFLYAIAIVAILFSACQPEPKLESKLSLDDFETVNLPSDNVTVDSTNAKFVNGNGVFSVNSGGIWNGGIVCSAQTDTVSGDYTNQYSSISGTGAPESNYISTKYGVVYGNGRFTCAKDPFGYFTIKSMMLNNSTYTYRTLVNGNAFSRKFVAGDWFKVSIIGYKNNVQSGSVDYYLADFRNGKTFILKTWTIVDLTSLGEVDKVSFDFDSSDKGQWINTPTYVCIDNIYFTQNYSYPLGLN